MNKIDAKIRLSKGYAQPYGISVQDDGFNFAIFSKKQKAILCLLDTTSHDIFLEISLDNVKNKTGNVWHILIHDLPPNLGYAFRLYDEKDTNKLLVDPFVKEISSPVKWDDEQIYAPLGLVKAEIAFDWENDRHPDIPSENLIVYEMHVRGFTQHESSNTQNPGTFLGIIEKIPYLLELGINAIELLPIQEFNECENHRHNPFNGNKLYNYWGYSTVNFFSPMNRYASKPGAVLHEFKTMVKELHRHGIEVFLDVVFNHTAEGGNGGPIISFKGIDLPTFYILNSNQGFQDYSGCGNTFNCNHPFTCDLILNCLRYWVAEMHVDGFRFDLASIFTRDKKGHPVPHAHLIEAISLDPILSKTKLVAEPWDAAGLYQVGSFYQDDRWGEWNGKYRDTVRRFIKGTSGMVGKFATRICGSQDLYYQKSPNSSYNFITIHDGFTLNDLVSYNEKHNMSNGEENRDGNNDNDSWNCGIEGITNDKTIIELRERQKRNFHLVLMLSQGIPMLLMGDEYGHTKRGNNNTWCQDNELNWFLWDNLTTNSQFYRFFRLLIQFRNTHKVLKQGRFLTEDDIQWHGEKPLKPNWDRDSQFLAFTLIDHQNHQDLYAAFNAQNKTVEIEIPSPLNSSKHWCWIINTANLSPYDFFESILKVESRTHIMPPYSALLLKCN